MVALEPGPDTDDDDARKAHEEAEAKRKAKWESDQREKRAAEKRRENTTPTAPEALVFSWETK